MTIQQSVYTLVMSHKFSTIKFTLLYTLKQLQWILEIWEKLVDIGVDGDNIRKDLR